MFVNKQLRKESRIRVQLESVCCFKNVMCVLFLFSLLETIGEYLMYFTPWCSHLQGLVVQVGHGGTLMGKAL